METGLQTSTQNKWILFGLCWLGGAFAGMDANLFTLMLPQILGSFEVRTVSQVGAYILSSFLFGWMAGGIIGGWLSDKIGRIRVLSASILCYAFFTLITAYAQTPLELGIIRFLTGVGDGAVMVSISILLAERWTGSSKAAAVGALITSYQTGVLLSGFVGTVAGDYQTALLIGGAPAFLAPLIFYYLPESYPTKYASRESLTSYWPSLLRGGVTFGSFLIAYWAAVVWVPTWIQSLPGASSSGYEKNMATIFHGLLAILGCLAAGPLSDKIGRPFTIALSLVGSFILSFFLFTTHTIFSTLIWLEFGFLGLFVGCLQASLYIYLPELFPIHIRGAGTGFCMNAGRVATALLILFMGPLVQFFDGYAPTLLAFSFIYLVGIGAVLFRQTQTSCESNA